MRHRAAFVLVIVFTAMTLSGCWDRRELNELAITAATSLDRVSKSWVVSYQVVIPQSISSQSMSGGGSQAPVMVFSTSGDSIRGAVQRSSFEMPRAMFFGHNRIIVIGEEAARFGIGQLVDNYLRNPNSRETVSMFVTKDRGRSVLEHLLPLEKIPGNAVFNLIRNEEKNGSNFRPVMIYDFALAATGDSGAAVIPEISISGNGANANSLDRLKTSSSRSRLKLDQLGVFKKDKLVGWLSQKEAYGVSWLTNRFKQSVFYFGCTKDSQDLKSAMRVQYSSTKLTPRIKDEEWTMQAEIKIKGTLVENDCAEMDPGKLNGVRQLEGIMAPRIQEILQNCFRSAQALQADIFNFAAHFHRRYPEQWKASKGRWDEIFAAMKLETKVIVELEQPGMSTKPFKKLLEESE